MIRFVLLETQILICTGLRNRFMYFYSHTQTRRVCTGRSLHKGRILVIKLYSFQWQNVRWNPGRPYQQRCHTFSFISASSSTASISSTRSSVSSSLLLCSSSGALHSFIINGRRINRQSKFHIYILYIYIHLFPTRIKPSERVTCLGEL